jgi:hypothetical protein
VKTEPVAVLYIWATGLWAYVAWAGASPIKMVSSTQVARLRRRADQESPIQKQFQTFGIPGHCIALAFAFLDQSANGHWALAIADLCWRSGVLCTALCSGLRRQPVLASCATRPSACLNPDCHSLANSIGHHPSIWSR